VTNAQETPYYRITRLMLFLIANVYIFFFKFIFGITMCEWLLIHILKHVVK
jgi:hypothetical protein